MDLLKKKKKECNTGYDDFLACFFPTLNRMLRRSITVLSAARIRHENVGGSANPAKKASLFKSSKSTHVIRLPRFKTEATTKHNAAREAQQRLDEEEARRKAEESGFGLPPKKVDPTMPTQGALRAAIGRPESSKVKPKMKERVVIASGDGPTLQIDFSPEEDGPEAGLSARAEMEDLRRRITPENWKRFLDALDKVSQNTAFDDWAKDKTLEEIYKKCMMTVRKEKRSRLLRAWFAFPFLFMGMYGVIWPYHFFNL